MKIMSLQASIAKAGYFGIAAAVLLIFNLLDAIFTLGYVQLGAATEANPLMALPLGNGPLAFMFIKISLVSCCVALLWRLHSHRAASFAMFAGAGIYSVLICYHLSAIRMVARHLTSV